MNRQDKKIKQLLGGMGIAQVKSLPGWQRNHYLMKVKEIEGITVREVTRMLGVSKNIVHRAWT